MEYEYSFSVHPRVLPADWRDTSASPTLLAVWQLFNYVNRVRMDWTEADFKEFRKNLEEAGYDLEGVRRTPLPLPEPEDVE